MKQAKFALSVIIVLAIAGGALALKSNRGNNRFYSLTTTTLNGQVVKGCLGDVDLFYTCSPVGSIKLSSVSCTTLVPATTCVATVRLNG